MSVSWNPPMSICRYLKSGEYFPMPPPDNSQHEFELELFKAKIDVAKNAIRGAFWMNGGSGLGILSFAGVLAADGHHNVTRLGGVLLIFALGVFLSVFSSLLMFYDLTKNRKSSESAPGLKRTALCALIGAYLVFFIACYGAYCAFIHGF
jgi:hypothetical protein